MQMKIMAGYYLLAELLFCYYEIKKVGRWQKKADDYRDFMGKAHFLLNRTLNTLIVLMLTLTD